MSSRSAGSDRATKRVPDEQLPGSPSPKRRVYIVDDHVMLREGLSLFINGTTDLMICGESGSAEEALQDIPRSKADIAIVDLALQGTSGLELLKNLHTRHPDLPLLVLSMHEESLFAERALRAGASGYVMKHGDVREVQNAIRRVLDGGIYLSQSISDRLLKVLARSNGSVQGSSLDLLSDREIEVFEMIGRGLGNSEIARRLHLSVKTVEGYRARIKSKLDLKDAGELVQHALAWARERFDGRQ